MSPQQRATQFCLCIILGLLQKINITVPRWNEWVSTFKQHCAVHEMCLFSANCTTYNRTIVLMLLLYPSIWLLSVTCIVAKWCILEQKLLLTDYGNLYIAAKMNDLPLFRGHLRKKCIYAYFDLVLQLCYVWAFLSHRTVCECSDLNWHSILPQKNSLSFLWNSILLYTKFH